MKEKIPMVSVCMITYNHEKYITQAIEGALMQKTNFPIELIIGDDCSTDNTKNICVEYQKKYPEIIKTEFSKFNLGVMKNFAKCLSVCSGKYIALCEGDDYWTDPYKLQKQYNVLEKNPNYSLCFHNSLVVYENMKRKAHPFTNLERNIFSIQDIIEKPWFIPTQSIFLRKETFEETIWFSHVFNGDLSIQLLLATKGDFWGINEIMSVYRRNKQSITSNRSNAFFIINKIQTLTYFNLYTNFKYDAPISEKINSIIINLEKSIVLGGSMCHRLINPLYYYIRLENLLSKIFK